MAEASAEDARDPRLLTALVAVAAFMGSLDASIVNVSLPHLAEEFATTLSAVSWVGLAYRIALASTLILFGALADRHGFRRVYLAGFGVFTAASLLCGLAPGIGFLVGFRLVQGVGAAMLQAIGGAMIMTRVAGDARLRAFGLLAGAVSAGAVAGPVVGGFLAEHAGWEWIFFLNVPIGVAALVLGRRALPADGAARPDRPLDLAGAAFFAAALGSLLYVLSMGRHAGYLSPSVLGALGIFLGGGVLLGVRARRTGTALVDLAYFRDRRYTLANAGALVGMLLLTGVSFIVPFYLEFSLGLSTDLSGLVMAVPAILLIGAGPLAAVLSNRVGPARLCLLGAAVFVGVYVLLVPIDSGTALVYVVAVLMLAGLAAGLFIPVNYQLILGFAAPGDTGAIGSTAITMRNTGSALAMALYAGVFAFAAHADDLIETTTPVHTYPDAVIEPGFAAVFLVGTAIALLLVALTAAARPAPAAVPAPAATDPAV
jgi:EmrB/QacA subfamily drug resistance transporter